MKNEPPFDCPNCYGRPLGQCPFCGTIGPERPNEPPEPESVAMDAAQAQFTRMLSSNCWDYAGAVVKALREAGMIADRKPDA
jgi:hypothetical protein